MKKGDRVLVTYDGRTLQAVVLLASANQRSLMIAWEGMLGGHVSMMPILMDAGGQYRSLIEDKPVTLVLVGGSA